jgi:hypothetical protein
MAMRCLTFGQESPITGEINRLSWEIGRLEAALAAERARREAAERALEAAKPARPAAIVEIGGELADMHAFEDYEEASRFAREHDGWIKAPDSFTWHPSGQPAAAGGGEATP